MNFHLGLESLFVAVEEGNEKDVERILATNPGINLEERDEDGQTYLIVASQKGHEAIVRKLLSCTPPALVNAVDDDDWSSLLNAAKVGSAGVVRCLLAAGAKVDHRDMAGWTALMWASYKGSYEVAKVLLDNHANPNVKGEHHMSCLTWAAGRGHSDVVSLLIASGAKVSTADKYGTTPLIWACRKGHFDVVLSLLKAGAQVDKAGMNSWTPLIAAAAGGYSSVCRLLLEHHPNVNAIDKDGMTALSLPSKEGHSEVVSLLLESGAYSNIADKVGDTALIHACKNNHVECVRYMLKRYAQLDHPGLDHKTSLYWAVEKSHVMVVKLLLDNNANVEIPNKDGETPLLRAVRSRHQDLVLMLVDKGAKVAVTDKRGDNSLHLALRSRSKRISEILLRNPKNYKLLHIKNKKGETAYAIDARQDKSILTQVFGAKNLNTDDNLQGYELYSASIADVLSEPSLRTPITVGLFARWGSGKSCMIKMLRLEMEAYSSFNYSLKFSFNCASIITITILFILLYILLFLITNWFIALSVSSSLWLLVLSFYGIIWLGVRRLDWSWAATVACVLSEQASFLNLLGRLLFFNVPEQKSRDTTPIRLVGFIFTESVRLNTIMGEKSIFSVVAALCDAVEAQYGITIARLYKTFRPRKAIEYGRFKTVCCIPSFIILIITSLSILISLSLFSFFKFDTKFATKNSILTNSFILAFLALGALVLLGNSFTCYRAVVGMVMPSSKRVRKIASKAQSDGQNLDAVVPLIKREVDNMGWLVRTMDAFSDRHTRMVVVVDGLDSCEQDKLLNVLDLVHLLFNDTSSPFVILLSVDPHVLIKGIEHNISSQFRDTSINGYDYLRNVVHLPFYIQNQVIPKPPQRINTKTDLINEPHSVHYHKQDSQGLTGASLISLTDVGKGGKARRRKLSIPLNNSTSLIRQPSIYDLSKSLHKTAYFSDINPRSMKRLMNILALTSRLLRSFSVDFNWYKLVSWINLTEQWPYRLSWVIMQTEDEDMDGSLSIKNVYERVKDRIPSSRDMDPLVEIDRNVRKLEAFLSSNQPCITVSDIRRFLPCTINIDPYLRKLIKELQQNSEKRMMGGELYGTGVDNRNWQSQKRNNVLQHTFPIYPPTGYSPYFCLPTPLSPSLLPPTSSNPPSTLEAKSFAPLLNLRNAIRSKPLEKLTCPEVCELLRGIDGINHSVCHQYTQQLTSNNINGMVLSVCDLGELKVELSMKFGDWELFKRVIECRRKGVNLRKNSVSSELEEASSSGRGSFEATISTPLTNSYSHIKQQRRQQQQNKLQNYQQEQQPKFQPVFQPQQQSQHQQPIDHQPFQQQQQQFEQQFEQQQQHQFQQQQYQQQQQQQQQLSQQMLQQAESFNRLDDSISDEVLIETEALLNIVEAVGGEGGDDDDDEVDVGRTSISPIPEEDSKNSPIPSTSKHLSREASEEMNNAGDRVFFMGPDQDSGDSDSEEVARSVATSTNKSGNFFKGKNALLESKPDALAEGGPMLLKTDFPSVSPLTVKIETNQKDSKGRDGDSDSSLIQIAL